MQINIDNEAVQSAIDSSVAKAIQQAVGGYNVTQAIGQKITDEVISGAIGAALSKALAEINTDDLVKSLTFQIQRTTTSAVCRLLSESMVELVMKIRGKNEYSAGYKEARAIVAAEITRGLSKDE